MRSLLRRTAGYAGAYVSVEVAAAALLIWALGLGWALLVLAVTFLVGVLVSASQLRRQVAQLRGRRSPQGALADGALVGLGSFLAFLPGVVTTAAGVLMLAPPTRAAMRPLAQTLIARGIAGRMTLVRTGQVIDGEVVDGEVVDGQMVDGQIVDGTVIDGTVIGTPNLPAVR